MAYNAKNLTVSVNGLTMSCAVFGKGKKNLVMIPGLGDALHTVKGMAGTLSSMYKLFAREYRVYMFSRKEELEAGCSSRSMANDLFEGMKALGIEKADVLGVSQGGTIAQWLAAEHPETVGRLVLAVTYSAVNDTVRESVGQWIEWAERGDYRSIFADTAERSYTEARLKKYRPFYSLLSRMTAPKSLARFIAMAKACLEHDASEALGRISAPTLVIGGALDRIVGGQAAAELAGSIAGSELYIYESYGHGLYEEAGDFNRRVLEFMKKQ